MKTLVLLFCCLLGVSAAAQTATSTPATSASTTKAADDSNVERDFLSESDPSYNTLTPTQLTFINRQDGSITPEAAPKLIQELLSNPDSAKAYAKTKFTGLFDAKGNLDNDVFKKATFVINVIVWGHNAAGKVSTPGSAALPDQRWYVYRRGKLTVQKRLLGVQRFWFIYIHLNRGTAQYSTRYDFTSTQATPVALDHLYTLASIIFAQQQARTVDQSANIWGGKQLDFSFSTSDIAISSKIVRSDQVEATAPDTSTSSIPPATDRAASTSSSNPVAQPAAPTTLAAPSTTPVAPQGNGGTLNPAPSTTDGALDTPQTFHNEGPTWWDVSVGFPVTNVNEVSFDSSSGGLTPKETDKRRLFGLINFFPFPQQRMQLATRNFSWIPSVMTGLPLAGQPLHKPLVALGWGPPLLQFYGGAIIAKQPTPPSGSTLTKSVCTGWCPQFSFGINFGVKAIKDKLTKK